MPKEKLTLLGRIGESWKSSFRDVVLIVISILIAFALDAWWQHGRDQALIRVHMEALLDEMVSTQKELPSFKETLERSSGGTKSILELMGPSPENIDPQTLKGLFRESFDLGIYNPRKPTLESMLASGELSNVNPALLANLEIWQSSANDIRIDSDHLERNREIDFLAAIKHAGYSFRAIISNDLFGISSTKFPTDTDKLLRSVEVETVLSMRLMRTDLLIQNVESNIDHLEETLVLLKQELNG